VASILSIWTVNLANCRGGSSKDGCTPVHPIIFAKTSKFGVACQIPANSFRLGFQCSAWREGKRRGGSTWWVLVAGHRSSESKGATERTSRGSGRKGIEGVFDWELPVNLHFFCLARQTKCIFFFLLVTGLKKYKNKAVNITVRPRR
jgi:hypothetical protein